MKTHIIEFYKGIKFEYKITLNYLIFGFLWILFSDKILDIFVDDVFLTKYQTFKGTFFIIVTSIFLFLFVKEYMDQLRKTESQLYESEFKFNKLYENGPFGMVVTDNKFLFKKVNPEFCRMLGYTESELLGMSFKEITHPDDVEQNQSNVEKLIRKEIPLYKTDKRYFKKDGTEIWCSLTVTSTYDSNNEFLYNLAIIEDITARKNNETEINRLNERISTATRASQVGIWDWDIKNNVLVWDEQMYALYGSEDNKPAEIKPIWSDRIHPDDRQTCIEETENAIRGIKDYDSEFRLVWPDSSIHYIRAKGEVFKNEAGEPVRMVGINYDVTKTKRNEEEIRKLSISVEQSPASIIIIGLDNKVEYVNNAYIEHSGYSKKELLGSDYKEFISNITPAETYEKICVRLKSGKSWKGLITNRKKNGEIVCEEQNITPLTDEKGHTTSYMASIIDVTKEKEAEKRILQINEELEQKVSERTHELTEANIKLNNLIATKDKLFSIIGHDLKNPFNTIMGYSDLMMMNVDKMDTARIQKNIKNISESAKSAFNLLQNLLEWSSSQTGKITFTPQKTSLKSLYDTVLESTKFMASQKRITIDVESEPTLTVLVDNEMINTVLRNLVTNAIKFTPAGGKIVLMSHSKDNNIIISVVDNGVGIDAETIGKLFKLNEKICLPGTENEPGTGLGLILCKEFVEKNNGQIWAESEAGKGSSFSFSIPAC